MGNNLCPILLQKIRINLPVSKVLAVLLLPSGPGPTAVKARTATAYIVAGCNPFKYVTVLSTPVTSLLLVQPETEEPS